MGILFLGTRLAVASLLPLAVASTYAADASKGAIFHADPTADSWKTWILTSGKEMRLPAPPQKDESAAELEEVRVLVEKVDPAMQERIKQWDFWSPPHQWNEMMSELIASSPLPTGRPFHAFAMLMLRCMTP